MSMPSNNPLNRPEHFNYLYDKHVQHLHLKGLRPKTIDAYSRGIRRLGMHFDYCIEDLTEDQLLGYFSALLKSHSISTVKLDLYGLKFFYLHTLKRSWKNIPIVKSPKVKRLPDVLSLEEVCLLISNTQVLSYRVFFLVTYTLGLRLGETLGLEVGDIDAKRMRVHIRRGKGGKDRLVTMTPFTLSVLRRFWKVHQHPKLLFPNRKKTLEAVRLASKPLDRGGVQKAIQVVARSCGFKKRFPFIPYAIAMRHTY